MGICVSNIQTKHQSQTGDRGAAVTFPPRSDWLLTSCYSLASASRGKAWNWCLVFMWLLCMFIGNALCAFLYGCRRSYKLSLLISVPKCLVNFRYLGQPADIWRKLWVKGWMNEWMTSCSSPCQLKSYSFVHTEFLFTLNFYSVIKNKFNISFPSDAYCTGYRTKTCI